MALSVMVLTTSLGRSPRTSASRPGTRHEASRRLDTGATRRPVSESVDFPSEESAEEGLSRGASALGTRSEWASMCSPHKRLLRRFKARCTASNSSQLMCQCIWGPVQTPDTASPLNVAPPALVGGNRVNHSLPGDLFQGHSCPKK